MPGRGYAMARSLRNRIAKQRGGQESPSDNFDRSGLTLAVYADQYYEYLRILNRAPTAIQSKRWSLNRFLRWAQERDLTLPSQITLLVLQNYQRWIWQYRKEDGKPLSIAAQRDRLGSTRTFFSWLCKTHVLEANPSSDLDMPSPDHQLPIEALSVAQVEALMAAPDIRDPLGIRDRAMLELFYSTAIRRMEMAQLKVNNLNHAKRILWVRYGKGRKDRVVPVGQRALTWVEKYLEDVRPLLAVDPVEQALFLTGYGQGFNKDVLGRRVTAYMVQAGIVHEGKGPHLLRHTCATHMHEHGADIRFIQQLLGHKSLDTTAIYTEVNIAQLQVVHARTHPAEAHGQPAPAASVATTGAAAVQ